MEIGHQMSVFSLKVSSQSLPEALPSRKNVILIATSALAFLSAGLLLRSYWYKHQRRSANGKNDDFPSPTSSRWKESPYGVRYSSFPISPPADDSVKTPELTVQDVREITPIVAAERKCENDDASASGLLASELSSTIADNDIKKSSEHVDDYEIVETDGRGDLEGSKIKSSWDVFKVFKVFLGIFSV